MKKSTTLFAFLLVPFFASAQNVVFTNNGSTVEDGATITVDAYEIIDEEEPEWSSVKASTNGDDGEGTPLPNQIYMKNQAQSPLKISATTTVLSNENASPSWCLAIGGQGQCQAIVGSSQTRNGTMAVGEETVLMLDADFEYGVAGSVKFKVEVFSGLTVLRTLYVNANYTPGGTGIHSSQNDAILKVANNRLLYKFTETGHHSVEVYNITGTLVKGTEVAQEGELSLETLPKGIYIYVVKTNGKRIAVQKCIIE